MASQAHRQHPLHIWAFQTHPKFHDTGISTNQELRPQCVGRDINASPSIELGVPTLHLFGNHVSTTAQPSRLYISHTFYRNPAWLCETR